MTPNAYVRSTGGRFARRAILVCAQMFDESMLPDVTLGEDEPAMAKVLLVVSILGAMALLILYGVLFPGSDIPALGDVVSLRWFGQQRNLDFLDWNPCWIWYDFRQCAWRSA